MNYWAVDATHSETDVSKEFFEKGIWYDGYAEDGDDRNKEILEEVNIGDILLMKSSATKGSNHSITFTKLKGVGKVVSKDDYYSFKIKWFDLKELPLDFDGISYRKTIEYVREDEMLKFVEQILAKEFQNMIINLLKYKHQIILQGPPGTGKTRLAKILAEDLIKPNTIGSPIAIINNFFSTFDRNNEQRKTEKTNREKLLKDFQHRFPIDSLKDMSLDDYCAGKGDRNNFCWWIETGLKSLGRYSPGSARSYLIYWSKDEEDYKKYGKLVKDIDSDDEAMQKIAELLQKVVKAKNPDSAMDYYGDSFLLKVLSSYFPDDFFPINGREALDNALKLFGVNSTSLTKFEKNKKLNELFNLKNKEFKKDVDAFEFMRFLFENFNLKTGEDIDTNQTVISKGEYQLIQFHPAYSYEDFVRGIVASTEDKGIEYKTENKILAEFAQKAKDNPNANYVLIIGTMNTADRSVGHIDYAIRRRFAFVDVLPDETVIISDTAKALFQSVKAIFTTHTSPDFKINDVLTGHSYFLADDDTKLQMKLLYEIKPILKEYLKDGVLLETAKDEIDNLNV